MSPAFVTAIRPAPSPGSGDWWERAACRGLDTSLFFPARGESTAEAKAVCASCPVSDDCLWFALGDSDRRPQRFGVWGGSTERHRRRERRRRALATEVVS